MDTAARHGGESEYRKLKREHEQYVQKVQALEAYARAHPAAYRRKLMLLAWLGFGAIGLLLFLALGLLGGLVWLMVAGHFHGAAVKFVLVVGVFALIILRSLFVRWPKPEGIRLKREEAPEVFDMVDDLSRRLNAPKIHDVILTNDFNAFAAQWPKLGIFGWYRNILALGLPYMLACSAEEFKATVAHELGHFSGSHGRMGNRIYRLNQTWYAIWQHSSNGILRWFMNWYQPMFHAYSFAFRRQNEYEADAAAVSVGSARANATDLMRFAVQGRVAHEYWKDVYLKVNEQATPPPAVYEAMAAHFKEPVRSEDAEEWIGKAFDEKTGYDDTHPSLTDRLAAMNMLSLREPGRWGEVLEEIRSAPSPSAAEVFLGQRLPVLYKQLDQEWLESVREKWAERHAYAKTQLRELSEIEKQEEAGTAGETELLRKAEILTELYGIDTAKAVYWKILSHWPDHAEANFQLGALDLEKNHAQGEAMLKKAAELDPAYRQPVYSILFSHHDEQGSERAEQLYEQAVAEERLLEQANERLLNMQPNDELIPHQLPVEEVRRLAEYFADKERVRAVYVVQKPAANLPGRELHLLIIDPVVKWTDTSEEARIKKLLEEVADMEPGDDTGWFVITKEKWLRKKLESMSGALIVKKEK